MKKYIIVFSLSILALTAAAQKKKKEKIPPPKPVTFIPEVEANPVTEVSYESAVFVAPVPSTGSAQIRATTSNRKEISFKNSDELAHIDLSTLKELSFKTMVSGKTLESNILQKVMNEGTQLEVLTIDNFALDAFPEIKIPNHRLKKLTLTQNKLTTLPASISNLTALEDFSCHNPLTALPASFAQLKNLQQIGLDNHRFTAFPKEIFSLNKLSILHTSGNFQETTTMSELPDLFQQLPELVELGVQSGALSSLPKSIATLKKLEHVNFSHNRFTSVPEVLATNPKLNHVSFNNNPLQWEPFLASVKKIKWPGLFAVHETGFTKKQYQQIQDILTKTDLYYDGMND